MSLQQLLLLLLFSLRLLLVYTPSPSSILLHRSSPYVRPLRICNIAPLYFIPVGGTSAKNYILHCLALMNHWLGGNVAGFSVFGYCIIVHHCFADRVSQGCKIMTNFVSDDFIFDCCIQASPAIHHLRMFIEFSLVHQNFEFSSSIIGTSVALTKMLQLPAGFLGCGGINPISQKFDFDTVTVL